MICTRSLVASYGGNPVAFADVDWPQGQLALLHGPSGSGKSTWLAMAAALKAPTSGLMRVAHVDMSGLRGASADRFRALHVGFLAQNLHLNDALSVRDNLSLAHWAAGVKPNPAEIERVLEQLGVGDLATRMPHTLSGGQAQRVALARAVLMRPKLILADEPTASLDDANAHAAMTALLAARDANDSTLVIATHDARVSAHLTQAGRQWLSLSL